LTQNTQFLNSSHRGHRDKVGERQTLRLSLGHDLLHFRWYIVVTVTFFFPFLFGISIPVVRMCEYQYSNRCPKFDCVRVVLRQRFDRICYRSFWINFCRWDLEEWVETFRRWTKTYGNVIPSYLSSSRKKKNGSCMGWKWLLQKTSLLFRFYSA